MRKHVDNWAVFIWAAIVVFAATARAQDPVVVRLYGSGVHAFFAGQYAKAHDMFTRAIEMGLRDPRVYYYRGLAYLKLGRPEQAEEDFRQGAELEARDAGMLYDVGRALERIQGRTRLLIEKHRFAARVAAVERMERIRRQRYGEERQQVGRWIEEQARPAADVSQPAPAATPPAGTPMPLPLPPPVTPTTERGLEPLGPAPGPTSPQGGGSQPGGLPGVQPAPPEQPAQAEPAPVEAPTEMPAGPQPEPPLPPPPPLEENAGV